MLAAITDPLTVALGGAKPLPETASQWQGWSVTDLRTDGGWRRGSLVVNGDGLGADEVGAALSACPSGAEMLRLGMTLTHTNMSKACRVNAEVWLELATEHAPQDQLDFDRSARSPRQIAAMSQSRSEYFAEHATVLEGELSTVLEMVMSSRPADPALAIAKLLTERRQAALARPEAAAIDAQYLPPMKQRPRPTSACTRSHGITLMIACSSWNALR